MDYSLNGSPEPSNIITFGFYDVAMDNENGRRVVFHNKNGEYAIGRIDGFIVSDENSDVKIDEKLTIPLEGKNFAGPYGIYIAYSLEQIIVRYLVRVKINC